MMARWLFGSTARISRQILSASPGSLSKRYRSAFSSAAGMASLWSRFSSAMEAALNRGSVTADAIVDVKWLQRFNDLISALMTARAGPVDHKLHAPRVLSTE